MPKLETWRNLPDAVGAHLVQRMRERNVSIDDLNRVRIWIESKPEVPVGLWFKDFGSSSFAVRADTPKESVSA
jgi:hypothetical protein